jgi:hypothetical protein
MEQITEYINLYTFIQKELLNVIICDMLTEEKWACFISER